MKMILGTKVGMTSLFDENGRKYAATVVYIEPNQVLEVKNAKEHGYDATKVGYQTVKEKSLNKPKMGEFKKANSEPKRFVKEFKGVTGYNVGDQITCDVFEQGQYVDAQAISKGHGFTGSIKRHNFSVGPLGHGAGYPHRYVGSISGGRGGSQAQRVFKGTELPGHYGHETITISNQLVLDVIKEKNLIIVHGAIPGPAKGLVCLKLAKKKPTARTEVNLVNLKAANATEVKVEEVTEENVQQEVN
ncbi:MAG: 50S ribosomal protein L3 [Mycoplasma sp.]